MTELLEVVLENILRPKVYHLLIVLLKNAGKIVDVQCSETLKLSESGISEGDIDAFINIPNDACLLIKLSDLQIAGTIIPSVLLRLVKYGDQFDIDFNFDESDVKGIGTTALMKKFHAYITELGEGHEVAHWFGGLEPASDEDTRYFTDGVFGPLG